MEKIGQVTIFGGTHGDEMSGVYLVSKWLENPQLLKNDVTCPIVPFIANPEAVKLCRRYKDCDLNRQFSKENYSKAESGSLSYEVKRARELHDKYGEDTDLFLNGGWNLIIDLHNTTANMKCCVIVSDTSNIVTMHMAKYIKDKFENGDCNILVLGKHSYASSRTLTKYGIALEIGPQPQGVLRADICDLQERSVHYALEFVQKFNDGFCFQECDVTSFDLFQSVSFPKNCRPGIDVMIHENVQDNDYKPITLSDPVLRKNDGTLISLKEALRSEVSTNETLYPVFVNEAAYYEKDLSFWLTTKSLTKLPSLQAK